MVNEVVRKHTLVAILWLAALPALADPPGARAAAEAAGAGRGFRDWQLACAGGCDISTVLRGADGQGLVTARMGKGAARLEIATPLPLFLPDGLTLTAGDAPPWVVAWRTCDTGTCRAELLITPEIVAALQREARALVEFTLVDGTRVRLALSLRGFSAAERALSVAP